MDNKTHNDQIGIIFKASMLAIAGFAISLLGALIMLVLNTSPLDIYNLLMMSSSAALAVIYIFYKKIKLSFPRGNPGRMNDTLAFTSSFLFFIVLLGNTYFNVINLFYRSETITAFIKSNIFFCSLHYNFLSTSGFLTFIWCAYLSGFLVKKDHS